MLRNADEEIAKSEERNRMQMEDFTEEMESQKKNFDEMCIRDSLLDLSDPHQMKDMDRLVEILAQKIRKQVRIRIIGDYDVDGVTSSHLFLTALRRVGAKVDVVIPHRIQDGYGLSLHLLQQAKEDGVDTILTCDNGIAAIDEIAWAKACLLYTSRCV